MIGHLRTGYPSRGTVAQAKLVLEGTGTRLVVQQVGILEPGIVEPGVVEETRTTVMLVPAREGLFHGRLLHGAFRQAPMRARMSGGRLSQARLG
jgi:hypothetical protein